MNGTWTPYASKSLLKVLIKRLRAIRPWSSDCRIVQKDLSFLTCLTPALSSLLRWGRKSFVCPVPVKIQALWDRTQTRQSHRPRSKDDRSTTQRTKQIMVKCTSIPKRDTRSTPMTKKNVILQKDSATDERPKHLLLLHRGHDMRPITPCKASLQLPPFGIGRTNLTEPPPRIFGGGHGDVFPSSATRPGLMG